MSDLYQQLDNKKNRKVSPRINDGFVDKNISQKSPIIDSEVVSNESNDSLTTEKTITQDVPNYIVETSKSKLLTLEVGVRQELDLLLYENRDVSWDTILEAALVTCLNNQKTKKKIIALAQERLMDRKKTAVYKRTKTMAQKYV